MEMNGDTRKSKDSWYPITVFYVFRIAICSKPPVIRKKSHSDRPTGNRGKWMYINYPLIFLFICPVPGGEGTREFRWQGSSTGDYGQRVTISQNQHSKAGTNPSSKNKNWFLHGSDNLPAYRGRRAETCSPNLMGDGREADLVVIRCLETIRERNGRHIG